MYIVLPSYPGSGNTWLRAMLEAATGLRTGEERDWQHQFSRSEKHTSRYYDF